VNSFYKHTFFPIVDWIYLFINWIKDKSKYALIKKIRDVQKIGVHTFR